MKSLYLVSVCAIKDGHPHLAPTYCIVETEQEALQFAMGLGTGLFPGYQVWVTVRVVPNEAIAGIMEALALALSGHPIAGVPFKN